MIVNDRIVTYIQSLESGRDDVCDQIEKYAHENRVPIIRKEMESFLRVMIMTKQPSSILEVGSAIGYSAILMAKSMPKNCHITTIENYEKRIPIATENIKRAGLCEKITLINGDAMNVIPSLNDKYDFIFMDAAKGQYINFLPLVLDRLNPNGLLISDNVLQDGDIVESRFGVERRNRTIHSRMREYLYTLKHMETIETSIVPIGDGITVSIKLQ